MRRSQVSVELLVLSAVILSVFLSMFVIINYRNDDVTYTRQYLEAKDIADTVSWNINEVYISGFNSIRTVSVVNSTKDGTPLNITVIPENRIVVVSWGERHYTSPIVTSRVWGNISGVVEENFTLINDEMNLTNVRGEVRVVQ